MSNERIDQILYENNLVFESIIAKDRIYRSMEQYGGEQYRKGREDRENGEAYTWSVLSKSLKRLQSLVQAQKELIEWMGIKLPGLSHENKCKMADFFNQIKELEK